KLNYSNQRFNLIYKNAPLPIISWKADGEIMDLNIKAEELLGWNKNEVSEKDFIETLIADKDRDIWRYYKNKRLEYLPSSLISRAVKSDGSTIYCSWDNAVLKDNGKVKEVISIGRYIQNYFERELEIQKLLKAVNETDNWIIITDTDGIIEYANAAVKDVTGYTQEELIGSDPSLFKSGKYNPDFYKKLWDTIEEGKVYNDVILNKKKNGELFCSEQTITPIKNSWGKIVNYISVGKDITENEKLKQKIEYISNYDNMFSLPNRKAISSRIDDLVGLNKAGKVAVLVMNIEKIKSINEIYSKEALGKSLIDLIADLINSRADNNANCLKIHQNHHLAYLGGDAFALLIDNINSIEDIDKIAENILNIFKEPIDYADHSLMFNISIGVSLYPDDFSNSESLLTKAETALINSNTNDYAFFNKEMNEKIKKHHKIKTKLIRAIKNDEFVIYYQPYYNGHTQSLYGLEALIRWQDPDKGLMSPAEFIPILEESHLIKKTGLIVIQKVVESLEKWTALGYKVVPVSINLSVKQLEDNSHLEDIFKIIEKSEINNSLINFEITETSAMNNVNHSLEIMNEMKKRGFKIAIDDFGKGYSSFNYLQQFPIDYLKIDISFIRNMTLSSEGENIVEAIINLAHILNLETIAEGVEKENELENLNKLNNDYIQGYYLNPPMPEKEVYNLLDEK
ncbi:MAG: EAL domain-containing protein, partial [Halanaerobium sp.]